MYKKSKRVCARQWCELNSWEWPTDLEGKPENWDLLPAWDNDKTVVTKYKLNSKIMDELKSKAGEKLCSEYWHLYVIGHSKLEFEWWWLYTKFIERFLIKLFPSKRDFIINSYYMPGHWMDKIKSKLVG